MSLIHRTFLLNSEYEGVRDLEAREIERNYDRDKDTIIQETNVGTIKLTREINDAHLAYLAGGLNGTTPGALEGAAYKETIEKNGVVKTIFDGYIDLTENHILSPIESEVVVKQKDSVDFLNDVVDGFSFEYMAHIGKILPTDYEWMPYVLNSVPDYQQAALSILSVYVIVEQVKTVIEHITELGTSMTNPFEVTAIVRMVIFVAYLVILFTSLVKLVKDIVQLLIQPVKYHACMSLRKHLEKGAEHLGYTFACPFFDDPRWNSLYLMPEKLYVPRNIEDNRLLGFFNPGSIEQKGFLKGTYGDALRIAKTLFKGKLIVSDTTITLLRRDQAAGVPEYQLAHEADSDYWQPQYELNADEFISNYLIAFETDPTDKNTIQEYKGTSFQVIASPITVNEQKSVLMKNLREERIPLALAKRKEDLTVPEKIIRDFLDVFSDLINGLISAVNVVIDVYNSIVKVINKIIDALDFIGIDVDWEIPTIDPVPGVDLGAVIENRIGMMKIENDNFTVPKIFMMSKGGSPKYNKIRTDNATELSARSLWDNFHFIDSFVPRPGYPNGNQAIRKALNNIPFTFDDDEKVDNNNMILDFDGNPQELMYLKWRPRAGGADLKVRFSTLWTTNIKEEYIEPDGN